MSVYKQNEAFRELLLGKNASKTGMSIDGTSTSAFTVSSGMVLVTSIVGIVTTIIGGATNLNLTHTPTGGGAGDICAATAIDNDAVGTIYTVTGVATDLVSAQTVAGIEVPTVTFGLVGLGAGKGIVLPAGSLKQKTSGAQTGAISWFVTWVPIENGASLAAA